MAEVIEFEDVEPDNVLLDFLKSKIIDINAKDTKGKYKRIGFDISKEEMTNNPNFNILREETKEKLISTVKEISNRSH